MEKLLTAREVAEALGVSEHTLANWRALKTGPAYIRVGGSIRYDGADLAEWLNSRKEKTHAPESAKRELALPILARQPRVSRKHRFGRHRTQQGRRDENRSSLGVQKKR
jgi:predicted DNA-binding transcriptional regulator AlpA